MVDITDADKLGMAALAASAAGGDKAPLPKPRPQIKKKVIKPRPITPADVSSGRVSPGDANDEAVMGQNYKSGVMIDRAAIRGRTKGKIC
jgi:hypothetical protein